RPAESQPTTLWSLWQPLEELRRAHERDEQLLEPEPRVAKRAKCPANGVAVGGPLEAAEGVAEHLFDDALLARGAGGEHAPDLFRLGERRARQTGDFTLCVDRQLDRPDGLPAPRTAAFEFDDFHVAPAARRVVVLEA